jgi:hypothetical protein
VSDVTLLIDFSFYQSTPVLMSYPPGADDDGARALLEYADGSVGFKHTCRVVDGTQLVTAPRLQLDGGHRIISRKPWTVEPSILCGDCGAHGFVRDGRWVPA